MGLKPAHLGVSGDHEAALGIPLAGSQAIAWDECGKASRDMRCRPKKDL